MSGVVMYRSWELIFLTGSWLFRVLSILESVSKVNFQPLRILLRPEIPERGPVPGELRRKRQSLFRGFLRLLSDRISTVCSAMTVHFSDNKPVKSQETIVLEGALFDWVKDRKNGSVLYKCRDGESFARVGPESVISDEFERQINLFRKEFPVAKILSYSIAGPKSYFIEERLGPSTIGEIILAGPECGKVLSDERFEQLFSSTRLYAAAQRKYEVPINWEAFGSATRFTTAAIVERPQKIEVTGKLWDRCIELLADIPWVYSHGDYCGFNIMERGVIDFEDGCAAPFGYDLASNISHPYWFPSDRRFEMWRVYEFSDTQLERYHSWAAEYFEPGVWERAFDALVILRGTWACANIGKTPEVQQWRFDRFDEMAQTFLEGRSIREMSSR